MANLNQIDPSVQVSNPLTILLNSFLYVSSNILATLLVISQDSMQLIQLIFTCLGIVISNMILIIVNWKSIKKWFSSSPDEKESGK
jgi:uncharacterized membrane protein